LSSTACGLRLVAIVPEPTLMYQKYADHFWPAVVEINFHFVVVFYMQQRLPGPASPDVVSPPARLQFFLIVLCPSFSFG